MAASLDPIFDKSVSEVVSLIASGERIDPAQSNLSLAIDNILYNPSWQHLDVWQKLLQTIVMAFVGTLFAALAVFPLIFLAARNITRNGAVNWFTKRRRMKVIPHVPEHAEAGERLWNSSGIGQVFFNQQGQPVTILQHNANGAAPTRMIAPR